MTMVIINGMTNSNWRFKRFERLSVLATSADIGSVLA